MHLWPNGRRGSARTLFGNVLLVPVPKFYDFFRPFLEVLHERGRVSLREMRDELARRMNVSDEERRIMLPSGRQRRFDNRVGWARTYLSKAGLIRTVSRGVYELTEEGRQLLHSTRDDLDVDSLMQFDAFQRWKAASRADPQPTRSDPETSGDGKAEETPLEALEENHRLLQESLADEIAEALQGVSWQRFEDIVVEVLLALGYGGSRGDAGHAFRASGDSGVDGVINEDRLGLSKIYVQAKRYSPDRRIGRPDVQAFVGSLLGQKARQGVFITTSSFSRDAEEYVRGLSDLRVILIDGASLAKYMIDFDVGVTEQERFVVKRLDRDYFDEEQ